MPCAPLSYIAFAVVLQLRPRICDGVHAAWIHDSCSGAEAVCLAEITRLAADPKVPGIALALGVVSDGIVFCTAVGRAWVAVD